MILLHHLRVVKLFFNFIILSSRNQREPRAWSRSAMISSGFSAPTQSLIIWGGTSALARASSPCCSKSLS